MINSNLKNYINLMDSVAENGSVYLPENFSWASDIKKTLPSLNLDLPQIQKKAKIQIIHDKKNPIYIQLSDGSKLFFTFPEFKRIKGKPEIGKAMIVTMQRLPHDTSHHPSQITHCEVV